MKRTLAVLAVLSSGCNAILGGDATPAATPTATAVEPTLAPVMTPDQVATPEETSTPVDAETPPPRGTPVRMETPEAATPVRTPRATVTPRDLAVIERTPKPAKTPRATPQPAETDVIDLSAEPTATPAPTAAGGDDAWAEEPATPEPVATAQAASSGGATDAVKVASLTLPKGSDVSLVKIDASANSTQSFVDVQLSGPARYKILQMPSRRQVWVDLDIPSAEAKSINATGSSAVQSIAVKSFEGTVRVVVQLKDDGKAFPVILPKKRGGEAALVQVRIGPDPE